LINVTSTALPKTARVLGFRGHEAISRPYEHEIYLLSHAEEELDLADALGGRVTLTVDPDRIGTPPFLFTGVLASVEILQEIGDRSVLRAVMVPRLWQLGLSRHSRMFTKMNAPDVIKAVLEDNGLSGDDVELRLTGSYDVEEHICQYRESDLDFISRWMEREGIYYFFEHTEEGDKLVLCDHLAYDLDPLGTPVRYFPQIGNDWRAGAALRSFTCRHATLPAQVKLRDYDYARPNLNVSGTARVASNGTGEVSLYGERFFTSSAGQRLAKLRAEELLARQVVFRGAGTRMHLRAGYRFDVEDHPRASMNATYLTFEAHHTGCQTDDESLRALLGIDQQDAYTVEVSAIGGKTQFRAESRTTWPRIYGYENGTVDGSAESEYAQIDEQGRYNVKLKFDESDLRHGAATTFVRMMQPHGGGIEGFHFPLRKGTEVVLSFLGGDPDRPVISGVVPNMLTPSPVTSGNHTKNVIQTGGRNRLELEDRAGQQRVTLSTPYSDTYLRIGSPNAGHEAILKTNDNMLLHTGQSKDIHVGKDWTIDVHGKKKETVHGTVKEIYKATKTEHVDHGLVKETYKEHETTIATEKRLTTLGPMKVTNFGHHAFTNLAGYTQVTTSAPWQMAATAGAQTVVLGGATEMILGGQKTDVLGGIHIEEHSGPIDIKAAGDINIEGEHVEVTSRADWKWNVLGTEVKFSHGSSVEFALEHKTTFTAGIDNSFFIGGVTDVMVGSKHEAMIGGVTSLTIAKRLELTMGAALCIDLALSLTFAPLAFDLKLLELKNGELKVSTEGLHIDL
jgi:type VI secretion system secreted protein VgrG